MHLVITCKFKITDTSILYIYIDLYVPTINCNICNAKGGCCHASGNSYSGYSDIMFIRCKVKYRTIILCCILNTTNNYYSICLLTYIHN